VGKINGGDKGGWIQSMNFIYIYEIEQWHFPICFMWGEEDEWERWQGHN
jgi:hypothetical protein